MDDINIIRGDTETITVTFTDSDSVAIDITGYSVWFTVRRSVPATSLTDDTDALISKEFTTGGATGIATFAFSETDTTQDIDKYYYDVQYKDGSNNIVTVGVGYFNITSDITRSS